MKNRVYKSGWKQMGIMMLVLAFAALMAAPMTAVAQEDYEYEAGQGLHEEEWYDPSDWWDTEEGVSFERDWYDYTYQYPYTYDYDYDYDYPERGYYGDEEFEPYEDEFGEYEEYRFDDDYDYFTDTWFDEEDEFDEWYE